MSFTRKIGQHFIWRGLYFGSTLLSNILFARILGADNSGSFFYIVNNISLLILFAGFCLETSFIFYGSSNQIAAGKLLVAGITWSAVAAGAGAVFGMVGISSPAFSFPPWLWAVFTASYVLINYCSALFNVQHDFKTYNLILALVNLIFIVGLVAFEVAPKKMEGIFSFVDTDINGLISLSYIFTVITQGLAILIFWLIRNRTESFAWPSQREWLLLFRYASLSLTANVVFFLVYRVDYWFIEYFRKDQYLLGNYIQVSKLGQLFILIPSMVATVIFPATALTSQSAIREELIRLCRIFSNLYLLVLLLISSVSYWLFPFVFGPSFDQMYGAFIALVPGIVALSVQSLLAAWFAGKNKVRYNVYGALMALVIIVVLNLVLIPPFGIIGAALSSSIGYIAYCLFCIYQFRKEEGRAGSFGVLVKRSDFVWIKNALGF